ncbi:hypothetical protein JXQ70_17815 [bacterium]|nr:hypothetical protein [bacterium]
MVFSSASIHLVQWYEFRVHAASRDYDRILRLHFISEATILSLDLLKVFSVYYCFMLRSSKHRRSEEPGFSLVSVRTGIMGCEAALLYI